MFVLALDTSSAAVTAGVVSVDDSREPAVLAERSTIAPRGHGELLAPSIDAALAATGIAPRDLGAVVVGTGPGPFTGLRVGLVTAAVLSSLLEIPAYGVCSLDAISERCRDEPDLLVATDARRREVYWARYRHGVRAGDAAVARPADVPVDGIAAATGAGAAQYAEVWPGLRLRDERHPDVESLVRVALDRILEGPPSDPLTPLYLRRPDAVAPGAPKTVTP